jgi:iron(III) transport system ATP-binding protein
MARITLSNLTKSYSTLHVVRELTLYGEDREFITLLGPSGCGKTTILRLIAGFMKPDAGEVLIDDRLLSSPSGVVSPDKRGMGMMFQNYALWPHMTVFENVAFGLRVKRLDRRQIVDRVEHILQLVGMHGLEHKQPAALSGGQQQRVALARSLVTQPSVLLLDEPLSNLDTRLRERMRTELKHLQRQTGITFVYVTHDQVEAMSLSDRVAVVNRGVLQQFASPQDIYERPANRFVAEFVGSVNIIDAQVDNPSSSAEGSGLVVLSNGARMRAQLPGGLIKGSPLTLIVRPEDILVGAPDADGLPNVLRGSISDRLFLGNSFDYRIDVGGIVLRATAPRETVFAAGENVHLRIEPNRLVGMPKEAPE